MSFIERLRLIIEDEGLSQRQFAELIDIPLGSLEHYLSGKREAKQGVVSRITNHPRLQKYTLWLMTETTAPESGQVCPAFSNQGTPKTSQSVRRKA